MRPSSVSSPAPPPHAGEEHGPKYLNTPDTPAFTKSDCLYGPAGALDALRGGAAPVLVEGPFDAIAVTLAGGGAHIGLAPLGTAFTDAQADRLRPHLQHGTIVAADNDPAGRAAAIRAYWRLVARGDSPAQLLLPDGLDPATLLHTAGAAALRDGLQNPRPLVQAVIDERIARYAGRLHTAEGVVAATRAAAEALAPLPPEQWPRHLPYLTGRVDALPGAAQLELLDAAGGWDNDRQRILHRRLAERITDAPPPASGQAAPTRRWLPLVGRVDPRLPHDPHWAALADALDRADRSGYDITANLPRLATHPPLPDRHTARTLHSRLAAETEAALTPPPTPRTATSAATAEPPRPAGTPPAGVPATHRPVPR